MLNNGRKICGNLQRFSPDSETKHFHYMMHWQSCLKHLEVDSGKKYGFACYSRGGIEMKFFLRRKGTRRKGDKSFLLSVN
jgi:hypothetical protein